jgi:beta-phosphoglucomutase
VSGLQAVLLGLSGVVADDERIQADLINQLLVDSNLRPLAAADWPLYRLTHAGQADRIRLRALWAERGRILDESTLKTLIERKQTLYCQRLTQLDKLPLIGGIRDLINTLETLGLEWILVAGTSGTEVEALLTKTGLTERFRQRVTGDDLPHQNPLPEGILHQLALQKLGLSCLECLGLEATYAGIQSGLSADLEMVGIPTVVPMHMLQRRVDWVFDSPDRIDWRRLLHWREVGEDREVLVEDNKQNQ